MRDLPIPNPRFTGLFLPAEILEMDDLTHTDVMLLSWIDALYSEEHQGCYASNAWFAHKLKIKENTVKVLLAKLKQKKLIKQVSFDGRIRVIRAAKEEWFKQKTIESTAGVDLNQPLGLNKINPWGLTESTPHHIYSKEDGKGENKGKNNARAVDSKSKKNTKKIPEAKISYGNHVQLKDGEYGTLCEEMGNDFVSYYIEAINNHVPNSKPYKDYASTIRTWYMRDQAKGNLPILDNLKKKKNKQKSDQEEDLATSNKIWFRNIQSKIFEKEETRRKNRRAFAVSDTDPDFLTIADMDTGLRTSKIYYKDPNFKEIINNEIKKRVLS